MSEGKKVLIIDDEKVIRQVFTFYLEDREYEVITAENGKTGMELFDREKPDLVLTDLRMPEADGIDVLKHIRETRKETPVIVISGINKLDDAVQALKLGAWDYLIKPVQDLSLLGYAVEKSLEKANLIQENKNYREHLEELVEQRTRQLTLKNWQLEVSRRQIIGILSQAAEYKDFETGNHFLRVSEISAIIAEGMGWSEERIITLKLASPVHDIGKIGIPDEILLKPGKLERDEWNKMKLHCDYGKDILTTEKFMETFCTISDVEYPGNTEYSSNELIDMAGRIALYHHEHWDGNGYPDGKKEYEIPEEARITAIADVFDALSSDRPYKKAWHQDECIKYIRERSGTQFEPALVDIFLNNIDKIKDVRKLMGE